MTRSVPLGQLEVLVEALPVQDQLRLANGIRERLLVRPDNFTLAQDFLKICVADPVRPDTTGVRLERPAGGGGDHGLWVKTALDVIATPTSSCQHTASLRCCGH